MNDLIAKFEKMGAEAVVEQPRSGEDHLIIDIRDGTFVIRKPHRIGLEVLDLQPGERHLLLLARGRQKSRFLCGHDERHWFVAAIPEAFPVSTVRDAMEALKPEEVQDAERRLRLKPGNEWKKNRRKNEARVRQGEWFFIPARSFVPPDGTPIQKKEPLGRVANGRFLGRPHTVDEVVRFGGETVFIPQVRMAWNQGDRGELQRRLEREVGTGLTAEQQKRFIERHPEAQDWQWSNFVRNPEVYVRGRVRHPDHKTIRLKFWHKVVQNTELRAEAMRFVAFVD